jgi:hypothetical protein
MTLHTLIVATCFAAAAVRPALAQEPRPAPAPAQRGRTPDAAPRPATPAQPPAASTATVPERPRREGQPINIRVDLTLTDQRGGAPPIKRTLTVLAADGYTGSIRNMSQVFEASNYEPLKVPLNVDASPTLLTDGKIRLAINLQYDWPAPTEPNRARGTVLSTSLHDQLMMILENGKPMIVAQSADPIGERQVTVEVKATILR